MMCVKQLFLNKNSQSRKNIINTLLQTILVIVAATSEYLDNMDCVLGRKRNVKTSRNKNRVTENHFTLSSNDKLFSAFFATNEIAMKKKF